MARDGGDGPRWGAAPEDWLHFDLGLGLGADLLPVVSRPDVEISPHSKMKGVGKTPSQYNRQGLVAGIMDWTRVEATPAQLAAWARQPDYGICVQTRRLRAFDVDVPDPALSDEIAAVIEAHVGQPMPRRWRANSGKQLLPLFVEAGTDLGKRVMTVGFETVDGKVRRRLIEFLASGQQFVAVGTHDSGARYQWGSGRGDNCELPDGFPTISLEKLEDIWADLAMLFAVEPPKVARERRREDGGNNAGNVDETAAWLEANWENYGYDHSGERLFVACPWRDGHSMDSGETEAAWLVAGSRGYELGHFECLHASCQGRTDGQFLDAVGYSIAQFECLPAEVQPSELPARSSGDGGQEQPRLPLPGFIRDKNGRIEPLIENVVRALQHEEACGYKVRYDTFLGEVVIAPAGTDEWEPYKDSDAVEIRLQLARLGFKPVGREMVRDAVEWIGARLRIDTAEVWMLDVVPAWDGVPRIDRFFVDYFGVPDSEYVRAVGAYAWTAQAGRVMDPGCKIDMVPMLQGRQGQRKSAGIEAIAPAADYFVKIDLGARDDDLARYMRGTLVAELDELKGLNSRDAESIKSWITKRHEKWVPKYREFAITFPRRCVFYASTNPKEVLSDDTGERRWLPMAIPDGVQVDVEAIERDRLQLWAEGYARWRENGVEWEAAERLARVEDVHSAFKVGEPWEEIIARWLEAEDDLAGGAPKDRPLRLVDVAIGALNIGVSQFDKRTEKRVGKALQALGYVSQIVRIDGKPQRRWVRNGSVTAPVTGEK